MIWSEVKIGPVGRLARREAFELLAADSGDRSASRVATLKRLWRRHRGQAGALLWQARRARRTVAAAMVVPNPGRFGMLLYSRCGAAGVDSAALARLLRRISAAACDGGLVFVQALVHPDAAADIAALESAGLVHLAELIYMRLDLLGPDADGGAESLDAEAGPWTWRAGGQFTESELCQTLTLTYAGSRDCPELSGVRAIGDVLAGHKASGVFHPSWWWLVQCDGRPAGCILVNGAASPQSAEVVYVGVVPAFRGSRLGRAMVLRAAAAARRDKCCTVTLAVDSRNAYAMALYEGLGFRRVFSRQAYTTPLLRASDGAFVEGM